MALCVAAAAGVVVALALDHFTLAWTHSIEKIRWEEDYRIEGSLLHLTEARIRGSGAGMDPPEGARLRHGVWHYTPALPLLHELRLANSSFAKPYELCVDGRCRPLLPVSAAARTGVIELSGCNGVPGASHTGGPAAQ